MKSKVLTALLFLLAAASVAYVLLNLSGSYLESADLYLMAAIASPLLFLVACALVFPKPRIGYGTGLVAGLVALPWFYWTELLNFKIVNSWIVFNFYDHPRQLTGLVAFFGFKILAVALSVIAVALCALRLLPQHWRLRNAPISKRTWPAFALSLTVLAVWFGCAAVPYRIPGIVDGIPPDLAILHVEKRGLQFHETTIRIWRDQSLYLSHNDRRLFQYRFGENNFQGILPGAMRQQVLAFLQSPQFNALHTAPARSLRRWNAEGWYVLTDRTGILAFSSEYGTEPPKEVMDLFDEIKATAPPGNWQPGSLRDVCLGFCYDPLAGLGVIYANERCRSDNNSLRCE